MSFEHRSRAPSNGNKTEPFKLSHRHRPPPHVGRRVVSCNPLASPPGDHRPTMQNVFGTLNKRYYLEKNENHGYGQRGLRAHKILKFQWNNGRRRHVRKNQII